MKTSARMLGTAALAVTMSLGVATPAAMAHDGHHHHGDGWTGWRFGDHRGWSHRDGWRHDWRDRFGDQQDRATWQAETWQAKTRGDKRSVDPAVKSSFARHQAMMLGSLARTDACLSALADRFDGSSAIDAYRALIADLIAQAKSATTVDQLRAILAQQFA